MVQNCIFWKKKSLRSHPRKPGSFERLLTSLFISGKRYKGIGLFVMRVFCFLSCYLLLIPTFLSLMSLFCPLWSNLFASGVARDENASYTTDTSYIILLKIYVATSVILSLFGYYITLILLQCSNVIASL